MYVTHQHRQVGTYDPSINAHNEKLVALNLERIQVSISTHC